MSQKSINSFLFPYERRLELLKSQQFKQMLIVWNECTFETQQKVGCIPYLLREAHEKYVDEHQKEDFMPRQYWGKFYNNSGKNREKELIDSSQSNQIYQINMYNGRTLEDFGSIARSFYNVLKERNFNFSPVICLNFIYIKIVDFAYIEYERQINTIKNLRTKDTLHLYKLSPPIVCVNNSIDVFVFSLTNKLEAAIQILPESYYKNTPRNEKAKVFAQQNHDTFTYICPIPIKIIYASHSGFIKSEQKC